MMWLTIIPACVAGHPYDLGLMSSVMTPVYPPPSLRRYTRTFTIFGGIVFVSFCLFLPGGVFLPFSTLTSVLHLKYSHQSN